MFRPIKASRMAETVVAQIREVIENGQLAVGEQLPGERVLADQFSVSRACVREALRILEVMGMVEVRQGLGTFVVSKSYGIESPSIWLPWLAAHRAEVFALLDVRDAIEGKISALAAIHASPHDLRAIRSVLHRANRPGITGDEAHLLDLQFHEALARAAGNELLAKLSKSIGGALATDRRAVFAIPGRIEGSISEHKTVFEAIVERDPEKARQAMTKHIEGVKADISSVDMDVRPAVRK